MGPVRQDDPTLPGPWQALYDPDSKLRYFWNPTTNVTQYEHPVTGVNAATAAPIAAAQVSVCELLHKTSGRLVLL